MKTFEVWIVLHGKHEHLTDDMIRNETWSMHGLLHVVLLVRIRTVAVRGEGGALLLYHLS